MGVEPAPGALTIRALRPDDWPAVRAIYAQGIATGDATFETEPPDWPLWDAAHAEACRLVACRGDRVAGWAALSPVSGRCVYAGVGEVSVYVDERARGRGVGSLLLARLVRDSEHAGFWTLQAGIFPENEASLRLHVRHGFRVVGRREKIGQLHGAWRDVLLLEHRIPSYGAGTKTKGFARDGRGGPPH